MPKSLGKRLDDQSIAVKKTVEEQSKEGLRLYADLAWKDCISDISYQSLEWIDWEIYSYDDVLYVAAQSATSGNYPGYHIFMSIDGETYAHIKYIQPATLSWVSGGLKLAAHNEHIVIEYQNSSSVRHRTVSHDYGVTWVDTYNIGYMPEDLIYANGYFVSHQKGAANFYCSSDNGATWTQKTPSFGRKIGNIAVLGDTFLFTDAGSTTSSGLSYSNNYYTTTDLTTYTQNYFPINTVNQVAVAYGNGKYVWIIGQYAHSTKYIYTSNSLFHANPGTTDWTASTTTPNFNAYNATCVFKPLFLDSRFLIGYNNAESVSTATKYYAYTAYSIDGSTWITITKDEIDGSNIARNSCLVKLHHRAWFTWGALGIFNRSILNILQGDISQIEGIAESIETRLKHVQTKLTAGPNVAIAQDGTISATDTTYTAGRGITITNNQIASTVEGGGGSGNVTFASKISIGDDPAVEESIQGYGFWREPLAMKRFDNTICLYTRGARYYSTDEGVTWASDGIRTGSAGFDSACEFNNVMYFLEVASMESGTNYVKICHATSSNTYSEPTVIFSSYAGGVVSHGLSIINNKLYALIQTDYGSSEVYPMQAFVTENGSTWTSAGTFNVKIDSSDFEWIKGLSKTGDFYYIDMGIHRSPALLSMEPFYISRDLNTWSVLQVNGINAQIVGPAGNGLLIVCSNADNRYYYTENLATFTPCVGIPGNKLFVSDVLGRTEKQSIILAGYINDDGDPCPTYVSDNGILWEEKEDWWSKFAPTHPVPGDAGCRINRNFVFNGIFVRTLNMYTTNYNEKSIVMIQSIDGTNWNIFEKNAGAENTSLEIYENGTLIFENNAYMVYCSKKSGESNRSFYVSKLTSEVDAGSITIDNRDVTNAVAVTVASKLPAADGVTITDALGALTATGFNSLKLVTEVTNSAPLTTNDSNDEGTWHTIEIEVNMWND